jgi:hypothetical protein
VFYDATMAATAADYAWVAGDPAMQAVTQYRAHGEVVACGRARVAAAIAQGHVDPSGVADQPDPADGDLLGVVAAAGVELEGMDGREERGADGVLVEQHSELDGCRKHNWVRLNAFGAGWQVATAGARPGVLVYSGTGVTVVTRTEMVAVGAPDAKAWAGTERLMTADRRAAAATAMPRNLALVDRFGVVSFVLLQGNWAGLAGSARGRAEMTSRRLAGALRYTPGSGLSVTARPAAARHAGTTLLRGASPARPLVGNTALTPPC